MKSTILFTLALLPAVAMTEPMLSVTWDFPTERVNGVAFDVETELDRYEFTCTSEDGLATAAFEILGYSEITSFEAPMQEIFGSEWGVYQCYILAVDTDGLKSDAAGPLELPWLAQPPKKLDGFNIQLIE